MTGWVHWHNDSDVETRYDEDADLVHVRNGDEPGFNITFTRADWDAFLASVRAPVEQQRDEARADAERTRLAAAIYGVGIDPDGYYAGTPGSRVRELLHAEAQLSAATRVVDAVKAIGASWFHQHPSERLQRIGAALDEFDRKGSGNVNPADLAIPDLTEEERRAFTAAASGGTASPPGSTLTGEQASGDHPPTPAPENAVTATATTEAATPRCEWTTYDGLWSRSYRCELVNGHGGPHVLHV